MAAHVVEAEAAYARQLGIRHAGPLAGEPGYDALIQAETGLCSVTGPPGQPSKVGSSICDISTGLSAYGEVLKALYARDRSGDGVRLHDRHHANKE
mgnify:CR=1 FL=1